MAKNILLDVVCYNAGLARNANAPDVVRTKDGFEMTVGTNHLGHFYLHDLLLPYINPKKGQIVVTASGVHDPASPGGAQGATATLGDLEGFERDGKLFTMVDGGAFNADKAYKDSKVRRFVDYNQNRKRESFDLNMSDLHDRARMFVHLSVMQRPFYSRATTTSG